jgi:predicted AlkP superfamily phosphohydrolase/phosphomutase
MAPVHRLCVIGIDAAEESLVNRWCADGALPTLDRLRRTGQYVRLRNAEANPSGSVWPTIYTGTHPGRHGIGHSVGIVPGTMAFKNIVPEESAEPPVWSRLAAAGVRAIVVDVPFAPLSRDPDSLHVVEWSTYERPRAARSWPPDALATLVDHAGAYPVQRDLSCNPAATDAERWRDHAQLVAGVAVKGAAIRWLASHRPWDFFVATFGEAHAVGHHFWDVEFGRSESRPRGAPTSPVRDVYRAIDDELAKLVDVLDLTTTTLIVMSGHGMGQNVDGWHLIDPFLRSQGLLVAPRPTAGSVLRQLRGACPGWIRRAVSRRLPPTVRTSISQRWLASGVDCRRSRAFPLPSDQLGFIRVNVASREPEGSVQVGREYDDLCQTIAGSLRRLVAADSGRPVVTDVFHTDQTFPGPGRERLPDLLVRWSDDRPIESVRLADGTVITQPSPDPRSGNHRPDGFAIVCGAGVSVDGAETGHLLDLAPTVLACFGLQAGPDMPGRSWLPASSGTDARDELRSRIYSGATPAGS